MLLRQRIFAFDRLVFQRFAQFGIEKPPLAWKRISTEEKLSALFQSANLTEIKVQRKNLGYYLSGADEWWDLIWFAGFRSLVNQLTPQQLEKFKTEHLAEIQNLATTDGIWLDVEVLYAIGVKTS